MKTRARTLFLALLAVACSATLALAVPEKATRNVAVVVFEGVELLDFAGPTEVFSRARDNAHQYFNVYLVASRVGEINTGQNTTILVKHTIDNCPAPDIIVIPGGDTESLNNDQRMLDWIKAASEHTEVTMSVCNGAFVLADLGMLDGLDITTYWSFTPWLRDAVPTARVHDDVRLCDNGHIVTTAGISAGIDGSLHLVERLCGEDIAFNTARGIEYDWRPIPLDADAPDVLIRTLAREAASAQAFRRWDDAARAYQALIEAAPHRPRALRHLGEVFARLNRTEEAIVALRRAVELDDHDASAWRDLGGMYTKAGRHAEAADALVGAIRAGWDFPNVHRDVAVASVQAGQIDRAIEELRTALGMEWRDRPNMLVVPTLAPLHGDERFRGLMREHALTGSLEIALPDEPGERITISGIVVDASGSAVPGALVSVYQTDATGKYTPGDDETRMDEPHSRIFGFVKTDERGKFTVATIRPGGYPFPRQLSGAERLIPTHIHIDVSASGKPEIQKQLVFADDPRMDAHWQNWARELGQPVAEPHKEADGSWTCEVRLVVGG